MGPYYQKTAQGVGGLVETLYDNPILIILFVVNEDIFVEFVVNKAPFKYNPQLVTLVEFTL